MISTYKSFHRGRVSHRAVRLVISAGFRVVIEIADEISSEVNVASICQRIGLRPFPDDYNASGILFSSFSCFRYLGNEFKKGLLPSATTQYLLCLPLQLDLPLTVKISPCLNKATNLSSSEAITCFEKGVLPTFI